MGDETQDGQTYKPIVFARQYRNSFSWRINVLVPRNQPIKTALGVVMHDFHGLKTMTFHHVAGIAYFWRAVTEIIQFFFTQCNVWDMF